MAQEAVIYCRASVDRTGAGLSVAGQEADCRAFAARHGLAVREVYADNDISASGRKSRPAYRRMLAGLAERPATVVVWHTDRLHRHMAELEEYIQLVEEHQVITRAVNAGDLDLATASGRMAARILGAVARHELEHMSERRRAGKARAAAAGRWLGGPRPFGYGSDGVTVVPAEAALVASATDAVLAGASAGSVTRAWNASGVQTSTGRPWTTRTVTQVLRRPRNAGLMEHQGRVVEGGSAEWPALVSEDAWRALDGMLAAPGRRPSSGRERRWLLSGLAECGTCGRRLVVASVAGKGRPARRVYQCRPRTPGTPAAGRHVARDAPALDAYVTGAVLARLGRPDASGLLRPSPASGGAAGLHARMTLARQRLDQAAVLFAGGQIDARQLATATARLNAEMSGVAGKLAALARGDALASFAGRDPAGVWAGLTLEQRRAVVATLARVVVDPQPKGRPRGWRPGQTYFDGRHVRVEWHR